MSLIQPNIDRSTALLNRSDELILQACQGHKRNHQMLSRGYPVFAESAAGARFSDVDGNVYVDYLMGFGPIVLGYDDADFNNAIVNQLTKGTIYSVAHPKEIELAEMLTETIPMAEMVAFVLGGSAGTSAALRISRAFTNRDHVVKCGYHGWHGWTQPDTLGVPAAERALTHIVPYGELDALDDLFKQLDGKVACVIVETIQDNGPPEGYLQGIIDMARQYGAVSIFDEVKVGCRIAFGGAGEHFGLTPDLSVFGKAWCNGFPGSFVAGRKEVMNHERSQNVWLGATFHCDLLSLVAMKTVRDEMLRRDGIAHQWKLGTKLIRGINEICEKSGLGYKILGYGPMPSPVTDPNDKPRVLKALRGCLRRGFYLHPGHPMFLSLAHTEQDIDGTIEAFRQSVADVLEEEPA